MTAQGFFPPDGLLPPSGLSGDWTGKSWEEHPGGPPRDCPSTRGDGDNRAGFDRRKRAGRGVVGTVPSPAGSLSSQPFPPFPAGIWSASSPNSWCYLSLPVSFPHHHTAASVWGQNNNQGAADARGERPGLPAAVQDPPLPASPLAVQTKSPKPVMLTPPQHTLTHQGFLGLRCLGRFTGPSAKV